MRVLPTLRDAVAQARGLRAEATTPRLKEHLGNAITRQEQIAAEIERASDPDADVAPPKAEPPRFQEKPPDLAAAPGVSTRG